MAAVDVAIVGAGPAGIASALACTDAGLNPLIFEREPSVASSWRRRYDRLRLNTYRPFSHLPDRPFAKGTPMFPSRDDLVAYLERHVAAAGLAVRAGVEIERLEPAPGGWRLDSSAGTIRAPQVIVATGHENRPFIPAWEGRDAFHGRILHSSGYRNAQPFRGERVLVVGSGSSGMEIAFDLAEGGAEKVWLSVRTPPNIILREGPGRVPGDMLGVALLHTPARIGDAVARAGRRRGIGDLSAYGLPVPAEGLFSRLRRLGVAPAIVDREVIDAIRGGRIEIRAGVTALDATGVALADGSRVDPDALVCATGYRPGLEPLVGHLGVLDGRGLPRALGADAPLPGLRFVGYVPRPGGLGYMGREARRAARAIARELGRPARSVMVPIRRRRAAPAGLAEENP